jgi:hypothetical protein
VSNAVSALRRAYGESVIVAIQAGVPRSSVSPMTDFVQARQLWRAAFAGAVELASQGDCR